MENKNIRNSSFELLRLIAMFSIVVYHQFLFLKAQGYAETWILGGYTITHFGVPLFLLITGYFGLKLKLQKIVHLYLYCFVWRVTTYLLGCFYFKTANYTGGQFIECLQPFTKSSGQWFLLPYFVLLLISPLLNKAINAFSKREFIKMLLVFSFIIFYFGLVCQSPFIDKGHSIIYFIYMYLIGRFLKNYNVGEVWKRKYIASFLFVYIAFVLLANLFLPNGLLRAFRGLVFAYIAPGQILSSVAIFLLFTKFQVKSKVINYIAASALSIYLFHENIYIPLKEDFAVYASHFRCLDAISIILGSSLLIMILALTMDILFFKYVLSIIEPKLVWGLCVIKNRIITLNSINE